MNGKRYHNAVGVVFTVLFLLALVGVVVCAQQHPAALVSAVFSFALPFIWRMLVESIDRGAQS